tara:strand:+ start:313 stop:1638 length:1326 start_codon:yes stop_codon:yes gene_type:complete
MSAPFKFKDCKKGAFVEVNSGARKPWYGMITKKENKKLHVKYFKEIIPGKTSASKGSKAKKWPENTPDDLWTWWAEKGGEYYTGAESIMEMGDLFEIFDRNDLPKDFPKDDFAFLNKPLFKKLLESEEDEEEPTPSPPKAKRGRPPKPKGPGEKKKYGPRRTIRYDSDPEPEPFRQETGPHVGSFAQEKVREMSEIRKQQAEIQAEGDALQTPIGTLASQPQSQPRVPLGTLGSQVLMESPMDEEEVQPTDSENEDSFVMRPNNFEREREENIKRREEDPRMQAATIAELTPVRKPPQPPKKRKTTQTGHKRKSDRQVGTPAKKITLPEPNEYTEEERKEFGLYIENRHETYVLTEDYEKFQHPEDPKLTHDCLYVCCVKRPPGKGNQVDRYWRFFVEGKLKPFVNCTVTGEEKLDENQTQLRSLSAVTKYLKRLDLPCLS